MNSILSPFLRKTIAFRPPFLTPQPPFRNTFFAAIVDTVILSGTTLYTCVTARAIVFFVAELVMSKVYTLFPERCAAFSVIRGFLRIRVTSSNVGFSFLIFSVFFIIEYYIIIILLPQPYLQAV